MEEKQQEEISELTKQFIDKLELVRKDYIKCKDDLAVSIRKDVVSAYIKSCIEDSKGDYNTLVNKLNEYIENLYTI